MAPVTSRLFLPRRPRRFTSAFTLLEICLALFIALLVIGVALPSLAGLQYYRQAEASFHAFDALAQQARELSIRERHPYLLVWEKERIALRRDDRSEEEPLEAIDYDEKTMPQLELTAALSTRPAPVWTFWPGGTCEPATVTRPGERKKGGWQAIYHPLTASATVQYE
ncbi:MAG TPA: hypothetical protein VNQ90_13895 [Chthoniobacteraceae bacterium]|nr:hypothetical protein [Chthoniobacteraceae bacterium]